MVVNLLPNEILHEISLLAGNDVKNLRLVDKLVNEAVDPVMWDVFPIILHLNRDYLFSGMSMLDDLSHLPVEKVRKFRKLEIKSLDPSKERHPPQRTWAPQGNNTWIVTPPEPVDTGETIEAGRKLPGLLPRALSALKGLESVNWDLTGQEPDWTHGAVLESLGCLPLLADIRVTSAASTALPLQHLINGSLQKLVIKFYSVRFTDSRPFVSSLATVLAHNPLLIHLELDMFVHGQDPLPFQSLFQDTPSGTVQLRSLLLSGWSTQLTPRIRPHLELLNSLKLPSAWNNDGGLWKSLSAHPPQSIRHISSAHVCDDLLDFLGSIPGLEVLKLEHAGAETDAESDRLARRFYNDILPRHTSTLRALTIHPTYTGLWNIGLHNLDTFDGCRQLSHLTAGLDPYEVNPGGNEQDVVASFISHVARLPELSVLALPPVAHKGYRGARCGTGLIKSQIRIGRQIQESLEKVAIPDIPQLDHPLRVMPSLFGELRLGFVALHDGEADGRQHHGCMPLNVPGLLVPFQLLVNPRIIVPGVIVKDIRQINFVALKKAGYRGAIFDKDNCLASWKTCKDTFGEGNVIVVSNSAGTRSDAGGIQAESVSHHLGVPVLFHKSLKPGYSCAKSVRSYFQSLKTPIRDNELIVVGDRIVTDVVMANRMNGKTWNDYLPRPSNSASSKRSVADATSKTALPIWTTGVWKREAMFMRYLEKKTLDLVMKYSGTEQSDPKAFVIDTETPVPPKRSGILARLLRRFQPSSA
ncbi:hypothetical protein V5O48_002386 [Marasmius crinis-equi]|uniref:Uncharacterized protein n=1 Tax=Marasmius crinis-equi TaxID=585013 RepID=A0ABR3FVQ9_9AGAR